MTSKTSKPNPAQVKGAAKALAKEGRSILKKHTARLSESGAQELRASLGALEHHRESQDWEALSKETEHLDELLQQHASFARKSAIRELVENVGFAVGLALVLRCCTFEPFNIPSISMMPTLRIGDYIFVNKFIHGIQIPFTNRIAGESLGKPIGRGEVIVFRYPIDESKDYIKRVIGIPGDVIRVQGQNMWIQKAGEGEFEKIERKLLDESCTADEDPDQEIPDCKVYEEQIDGTHYRIRLVHDPHDMMPRSSVRTIRVPQGQYFVRGDNRQQSQDSLLWEQVADIAQAHKLLRREDIREVLEKPGLDLRAKVDPDLLVEPKHARAQVSAPKGGVSLQHNLGVWRVQPKLAESTYQGLRRSQDLSWEPSRIEQLFDGAQDPQVKAWIDQGRKWDGLSVAESSDAWTALVRWDSEGLVMMYRCGKDLCPSRSVLGSQLASAVSKAQAKPKARAQDLLDDPKGDQQTFARQRSDAPDKVHNRYFQGRYQAKGSSGPGPAFEIEIFLRGHEGLAILRETRLARANSSWARANTMNVDWGELRWAKGSRGYTAFWEAPSVRGPAVATALFCSSQLCKSDAAFKKRVQALSSDFRAIVAGDLRPAAFLRSQQDLRRIEDPQASTRYAWDMVQSTATQTGPRQRLELELIWQGDKGVSKQLQTWRGKKGTGKDIEDQLGVGAFLEDNPVAFRVGFPVVPSKTALVLSCGKGLCTTPKKAIALAKRVADRAKDPDNFIARGIPIPQPFVPRGNIKGRADYIWWPLTRLSGSLNMPSDG